MPSPTKGKDTNRSLSITKTLTFNSTLSNALRRVSSTPTFDQLKLSHILNGETCPPISFSDFAAFVSHKEYSSENLLFVIWFRSYRSRWDSLPLSERESTPIPNTKMGDRHQPFVHIDKALAEGNVMSASSSSNLSSQPDSPGKGSSSPDNHHATHSSPNEETFRPCQWAQEGTCRCDDSTHLHLKKGLFGRTKKPEKPDSVKPIFVHTPHHIKVPPTGTVLREPRNQPMREEAQRAFATFLRPGGSRELGIADELRLFAQECLTRSTAPEVFLPIYEEVYQVVERQSLPHFLSYARTNINRPKRIFWFTVGTIDLSIGLLIYLLLTLLLPRHHFALRAIRLPSVIFVAFGCMQLYSSRRGFCTQVWGRSSRQVRPWELDDVEHDNEATLYSTGTIQSNGDILQSGDIPPATPTLTSNKPAVSAKGEGSGLDVVPEVHPLQDLGGVIGVSPGTEKNDWELVFLPKTFHLSTEGEQLGNKPELEAGPTEKDSVSHATSDEYDQRMAARRATLRPPSPSDAFPISATPLLSPYSRSGIDVSLSPASPLESSDISPFDQSETARGLMSDGLSGRSQPAGLSSLLDTFGHTDTPLGREPRPKIFGPETVVEDPRVKELFDSVVRDILVVGGLVGASWVAMCLAVPTAGLA
ncbi:hypothetical protein M231_01473 [Tremella mesenterica]|uniref:RGS domain-containing protein n=1 Tax=Tremella mesenterica TaxID=5217 RepID=A0A4Q1BTC6_TREME|nr:uncharacterized protein TREMEDRAFT_70159 [Tremella mesenterica DSM 1558]EIW66607.1 hypothetical protein TREMEDRAFT_70159 [Tremella mesenterica DSM 1558]RXK41323.1 hypothetical protein M231_01473 [Tremella mesenterica]